MTAKIMIIDDEPAIGKLLLYHLRAAGYEPTYIQDGLAALQRFAHEKPDLILLDVMMPHLSGWDICHQIRITSSIPIIMLTAKGTAPDIATALEAGASDYMTKPFNLAQLQVRIEALLRHAATKTAAGSHHQITPPALPPPALPPPASIPTRRLGDHIRDARIARDLSLQQAGYACRIRWELLHAIEREDWGAMPRSQLKHVLRTYTTFLGVDIRKILGRPTAPPTWPLARLWLSAAIVLLVIITIAGIIPH